MYELLLRIEALCLKVQPSALVAVGAALMVIGFFLWLGGVRYSTIVIGLLGAAVGAVVGLLVGQQFGLHLFVSMAVGAAILGVVAILVRNILIIVLATLVFAIVGGTTYASIVLDTQPAEPTQPEARQTAPGGSQYLVQSFSSMDPNSRQDYLDRISASQEGFHNRFTALSQDTWGILGPHRWFLFGAIVVGAIAGFLLVWLVRNVILPLCYSLVGTASLLLGMLLVLLGAGVHVTAGLPPQRCILPTAFGSLTLIGWLRQLLAGRTRRAKEPEGEAKKHED
ncbi:MAG: hypothetical protein JW993_17685 [Sedimentisphaerales bacterium]|nr:hypothetical protein [Sedimentisphaerales bacterium]